MFHLFLPPESLRSGWLNILYDIQITWIVVLPCLSCIGFKLWIKHYSLSWSLTSHLLEHSLGVWNESPFQVKPQSEAEAPSLHTETAGLPLLSTEENERHSSLCGTFATIQTLSIILLFDHYYSNYGPTVSTVFHELGSEGNELLGTLWFRMVKYDENFVGDTLTSEQVMVANWGQGEFWVVGNWHQVVDFLKSAPHALAVIYCIFLLSDWFMYPGDAEPILPAWWSLALLKGHSYSNYWLSTDTLTKEAQNLEPKQWSLDGL